MLETDYFSSVFVFNSGATYYNVLTSNLYASNVDIFIHVFFCSSSDVRHNKIPASNICVTEFMYVIGAFVSCICIVSFFVRTICFRCCCFAKHLSFWLWQRWYMFYEPIEINQIFIISAIRSQNNKLDRTHAPWGCLK